MGPRMAGARSCRLRSETGWEELGCFKMIAPRALVFRPLVKGNDDSGKEIARTLANVIRRAHKDCKNTNMAYTAIILFAQ